MESLPLTSSHREGHFLLETFLFPIPREIWHERAYYLQWLFTYCMLSLKRTRTLCMLPLHGRWQHVAFRVGRLDIISSL